MSLTGFSQLMHPKQPSMVSISNKASGGSIGTAAATVDIATLIVVNQTTASQTLTLPSPTDTTPGMVVGVTNVGTESFDIGLKTVAGNGTIVLFWWDGGAWN